MNIFVLDTDPSLAAQYHCDKHVVKMVLETAQLLSNCVPLTHARMVYRQSHMKHPCTLWATESRMNFEWLYDLGMNLSEEYRKRFGKTHKSEEVIRQCKSQVSSNSWTYASYLTPFRQVMPDKYKVVGNPVQSYRNYYIGDKATFAVWKHTTPPVWWPYPA